MTENSSFKISNDKSLHYKFLIFPAKNSTEVFPVQFHAMKLCRINTSSSPTLLPNLGLTMLLKSNR